MKSNPEKVQITVGEYYVFLLKWDCWINGRSKSGQAGSLLCSKLQEREQRIIERLDFLARIRNMSVEELKMAIVNGGGIEQAEE